MSYQYELIWFLSIIQTVKKNKRETFPPVDRIHHHIPVLISSNIARKGAINSSTDEIFVIHLFPLLNQLEMPPLALAAPSSTFWSNLSTALRASALASLAYASALLLTIAACLSASANY